MTPGLQGVPKWTSSCCYAHLTQKHCSVWGSGGHSLKLVTHPNQEPRLQEAEGDCQEDLLQGPGYPKAAAAAPTGLSVARALPDHVSYELPEAAGNFDLHNTLCYSYFPCIVHFPSQNLQIP